MAEMKEQAPGKSGTTGGIEENLKKAVSELLVLSLLSERDMHINELMEAISTRSEEVYSLVFPYALLYRLERFGYLLEAGKRTAADGRRRQYFSITEQGRAYLSQLSANYDRMTRAVQTILHPQAEEGGDDHEQ